MSDLKIVVQDSIVVDANLILTNEEYFSKFEFIFMSPSFKNLFEIEDFIGNLIGFQKNGDRLSSDFGSAKNRLVQG